MPSLALVPPSGPRAPRRLCLSAGDGGGAREWRSLADFWVVSFQSQEKKVGTRLRKVPLVRTAPRLLLSGKAVLRPSALAPRPW